ncbi:MAG: NF038122 family metalloprotease [Caulobacteraceae bacterium]
MQINLEFDSFAAAAPQTFRDAIQTAANLIDAVFVDPITVNLSIGYGELTLAGSQTSLTNGEAEAGPADGVFLSYASTRSALQQSLDASVQSGVAALPITSKLQQQSNVVIWSAEAKALGLIAANALALDGAAGFAADIPTNLLVGVALHELTHAMGRAAYGGAQPSVLDLFRFSSPGVRLFGAAQTAPASYFSLDGGVTDLADYGQSSDPSDMLNSSGRTPNDPFNEYYSSATLQSLTPIDILQMEALGFHTAAAVQARPAATLGDLNGDHRADVLMRDPTGGGWGYETPDASATFTWLGLGPSTVSYSIDGKGDFNGDGIVDVIFRSHSTGDWGYAAMNAAGGFTWHDIGVTGTAYAIDGTGDFNGDGVADITFRNHSTGDWGYAAMRAGGGMTWKPLATSTASYSLDGTGDFNGDGITDVIFRNHATGDWGFTAMSASGAMTWHDIGVTGPAYSVDGTGDFNGDGVADVIFRNHSTGDWGYAAMHAGGGITWYGQGASNAAYAIVATGDYNGDGITDMAWRDNATGDWGYTAMNHQGGYAWHDVGLSNTAYFVV